MDTVIETPYMPKSGETLAGRSVTLVPGGKGANQAYAAGKLDGDGSIIGAVADDGFGQKASSIAVTRKGAQTSIPSLEEVLA